MPYDDPDPQDPMMLVGVEVPGGPGAQEEMAAIFAEEFARLGYGEGAILEIFRRPFYCGAHGAWRALGEARVRAIVRETLAVWGRVRPVDRDSAPPPCGCGGEGGGHE